MMRKTSSKENAIRLDKYSKDDLIWIITYMVKWSGDFYLERALSELKYKKDIDRIDEADRYSKLASEKRREYIELLTPYDGKPMIDIPRSVLLKAERAMKEAQAADKQYCKLMGIKGV